MMRRRAAPPEPVTADSTTDYLAAIGRYRMLGREEENTLGRRIRAGDADAANELICANLRFVVSIGKQYQGRGVALLDLIDEGNLGLIRAAHRFDERRGVKFISYAVWWIRQGIVQALADQSQVVRVPLRRVSDARRVRRRASVLLQSLGREPTHQEIAEDLQMEESEVASTISFTESYLSLDAPLPRREEESLLDFLSDDMSPSPDERSAELSLTESIGDALAQLRDREAKILSLYFGLDGSDPMTLEQIGSGLGITRERVRQIRDRSLRKLRQVIPTLALAG